MIKVKNLIDIERLKECGLEKLLSIVGWVLLVELWIYGVNVWYSLFKN